ncbi:lipoprotein [Yersinia phage vB_YenS_P400]|nr:lipoprotein [Yersinia phage vB_YenS_P400]
MAIAAAYVAALFLTRSIAFLVCGMSMTASLYVGWIAVESFSVNNNGAEYLYYLTQSLIWLPPASIMRNSIHCSISVLLMSVYIWLVSIESFIWQFVTPVETFMHSQYSLIIFMLQLNIIYTLSTRGGKIGYINSYTNNRRRRIWYI